MNIRLAESNDFDAVKALWKTERLNLSIPFTDEILKPINEHRMYIIEDDDKLVAFCCFKIVTKKNTAELKHLCVREEYRRNGYGKMLFQKINAVVPKTFLLVLSCRDGADNNLFYDKYAISYTKEPRKTLTVRKYILDRNKLGTI